MQEGAINGFGVAVVGDGLFERGEGLFWVVSAYSLVCRGEYG